MDEILAQRAVVLVWGYLMYLNIPPEQLIGVFKHLNSDGGRRRVLHDY
jgi:hypothetical protein